MIIIFSHWPKATEHFIMLAAAWMAFSLLLGLFGAFNAMEAAGENIASQALIVALMTSGLTLVGGLLVMALPLVLVALIKVRKQGSA